MATAARETAPVGSTGPSHPTTQRTRRSKKTISITGLVDVQVWHHPEHTPRLEQKEKKDLTKAKFSYKMLVETIQEEIEIMEQKNTLGADVNEILMGYYAGGENWNIYGVASWCCSTSS